MTVTTAAVPAAAEPAGPRQRPGRVPREWRLPVAIAAVVLLGGLVIALLAPAASPGPAISIRGARRAPAPGPWPTSWPNGAPRWSG